MLKWFFFEGIRKKWRLREDCNLWLILEVVMLIFESSLIFKGVYLNVMFYNEELKISYVIYINIKL